MNHITKFVVLSDQELIDKYKIGKNEKILDVGGSAKQHDVLNIDTLVDISRPEELTYSPSKIKAKNFIRLDLNKEKFPFKDNEFDFCLCTHTLEDLNNPILAINEISRVAKRGYISTPSMGMDMCFSEFDITNWLIGPRRVPGNAHHKWFFEKSGKKIKLIPKNYSIIYSWKYNVIDWYGNKEFRYYWENEIKCVEKSDANIHELIDEYEKFFKKNKKYIKKGKVSLMIDNPVTVAKAYLKLILKRGKGFDYRK